MDGITLSVNTNCLKTIISGDLEGKRNFLLCLYKPPCSHSLLCNIPCLRFGFWTDSGSVGTKIRERHCNCLRCSISTYSAEFYRKVVNSSVKPFSPGLFIVARPCITELVLLLDARNLGISCTHCSVLVNHMFSYICLFLDFSKFLVYHFS